MSSEGIMIRYFDYDRSLLPNGLLRKLEEGVSDMESAVANTGYTVGYPGWNLLYYTVFCALNRDGYNPIVETGTNQGFSTIVLAQALIDSGLQGHVYTVELERDNYDKACANLKLAGVDSVVTAACGASHRYLESLVASLETPIRFAFLDASHLQEDAFREFELIYPVLDDCSTVFFDNTYRLNPEAPDQRVNGALKKIVQRYGGNIVNFPNCSWFTPGQAIWQRDPFRKDWE